MPLAPVRNASPETEGKVLHVLELLTTHPGITQRTLAEKTGVSLGLINIILKRLVETGSIKITQLTGRKVRYLLTPQGISEKAQRTYTYFSHTVQVFLRQQRRCESVIKDIVGAGFRDFAVLGANEIASLVELALKNSGPGIGFRHIQAIEEAQEREIVLDCRFDGQVVGSLGTSVLSRMLRQSVASGARVTSVSLAETVLGTVHTVEGPHD